MKKWLKVNSFIVSTFLCITFSEKSYSSVDIWGNSSSLFFEVAAENTDDLDLDFGSRFIGTPGIGVPIPGSFGGSLSESASVTGADAFSTASVSVDTLESNGEVSVFGDLNGGAETISVDPAFATSIGQAFVDFAFNIDLSYQATLTSEFAEISDGSSLNYVLVKALTGTTLYEGEITSGSEFSLIETILPEGDYELYLNAISTSFGNGEESVNANFNFELKPIPIPTSLALMLTGLGGIWTIKLNAKGKRKVS